MARTCHFVNFVSCACISSNMAALPDDNFSYDEFSTVTVRNVMALELALCVSRNISAAVAFGDFNAGFSKTVLGPFTASHSTCQAGCLCA